MKNKQKELPQTPPGNLPKTFEELYKTVVEVLIHGDKDQVAQMKELIDRKEECWGWIRVKLIAEAWETAEAKAREEFCLIGMEERVKGGQVKLLNQPFTDPETGIAYRVYVFKDGLKDRIPVATEGMTKGTYKKALEKKFVGDFIERYIPADNVVYHIPLDTEDKANSYNKGEYYEKYVYKHKKKVT